MPSIKPLFIGLYDHKLLGIRYLSSALKAGGYSPHLIFLKTFNSYLVDEPTPAEYKLLIDEIKAVDPGYIGISIMCSFYLAVVKRIAADIRAFTNVKIIVGGAYPTLFPEECLAFADVVCRGDGEGAVAEFTEALEAGRPIDDIDNLAFKNPDGTMRVNPLRMLEQKLDSLPPPDFGGDNIVYINHDTITRHDPESKDFSYEMTTSRGCPNRCSFCSNGSIRALYAGKGKYIRQRSVADVIAEIKTVRRKNPGLQMLRFWDEIFPWDRQWVEDFCRAYKEEIGLPFEVWGHPRLCYEENMKKLTAAGLQKVVVGIQSGSPSVRKDIYQRDESQEDILACASALTAARVPIVIYDFILGHPFENSTDLSETLELCRRMAKPFQLQLHGLSFLPGTPIEDIAVSRGVKTWEEIKKEQNQPLREQYHQNHWWRQGRAAKQNAEKTFWYTLIYLTQFKSGERVIRYALKKDGWRGNAKPLLRIQRIYNYGQLFRVGLRKLIFIIKRGLPCL